MIDALQEVLESKVAPIVKDIGLRVVEATSQEVTLAMPVVAHVVHGGGVLCGQAIMAAMDTAMVVALTAHGGGRFRPITTVQLQTTFMRPVPADAGEVRLIARVLSGQVARVWRDRAQDPRRRDGRTCDDDL